MLRVAANAAPLMTLYRAAAPEMLRLVPLDDLTLAYHRPAGATHLLAEPAPQIIAALQEPASLSDLKDRLEVGNEDVAALAERLDELIAAGLVAAA